MKLIIFAEQPANKNPTICFFRLTRKVIRKDKSKVLRNNKSIFWFCLGVSGALGWYSFVYFGCLRDPKWLLNLCDETPVFSKTICGNAKLDTLFWFVLERFGSLAAPFWHHFGSPWGPNGVLFK